MYEFQTFLKYSNLNENMDRSFWFIMLEISRKFIELG